MPPKEPATFGVMGAWKAILNTSAMGVIVLSFLWMQHKVLDRCDQDRKMFQEQMEKFHESTRIQSEGLSRLTESVRVLANEVKELRDKKQ